MELSLSNLPGIVWRRLSKREFAEHRSMGWFYTKRDSDRDGMVITEGEYVLYVSTRERGRQHRFLILSFPIHTYLPLFFIF